MGNPLRDRDPGIYRLLTNRTADSHLWMRPSRKVNKIIGGILARYCEIFNVKLYAYIFLSNHYHLLVQCLLGNADEFMENVNREIARRLNWNNRRSGHFWQRRYSEQKVLSEDDLLEALLYINTNSTKHGLVKNPALWPGLSSFTQSLNEKSATYSFNHYSSPDNKVTRHKLKLTPIPQLASLSQQERRSQLLKLLTDRTKLLVDERSSLGLSFLGVEGVLAQDPNSTPLSTARSPRPACYTKCAKLRKEYEEHDKLRRNEYALASMKYRLGETNVIFPNFTFKPPLHRKPRLVSFQPLPEDYFKKAA